MASAFCLMSPTFYGLPGGSDGKESACSAGGLGAIPGSGRTPGGGNGFPLQYSGLESPTDRGAWWAAVRGGTEEWDEAGRPAHTLPLLLPPPPRRRRLLHGESVESLFRPSSSRLRSVQHGGP